MHYGFFFFNKNRLHHILECLVITEWHYLKRIMRCGLVGGSMSIGVGSKVSKVHAKPSV